LEEFLELPGKELGKRWRITWKNSVMSCKYGTYDDSPSETKKQVTRGRFLGNYAAGLELRK
jgi:hypothetical protein